MSRKRSKLPIDRLSSLPDGVICHVLSFLPTQLSVSTCVLAKRWRFLWAHVPVWYFHGDMYSSDVIHRVMLRHKAKTIHTLRITSIEDEINEYKLETWVTTAMERNIRNLRICFGYGSIALLHQALFTCKTMVDMRLDNAEVFSSTGDICLPSLKKLHLSEVEFEDDEALPHLLSGCPLLQELILDYAVREGNILGCINISSLTIKRLELSFQICSMFVPKDMNYKILIDAPAVRCLRVGKCYLGCTTIPLRWTYNVMCGGGDKNDHSNLVEFSNHLRQIRCLKISCHHYLKSDRIFMERTSKMIGKSRNLSIDRLSRLPDEVICHILSFLPTKLSLSTCVLAKRWRFLWAHVPVWDFKGNFDGVEFVEDETPNPDVIHRVILWHKAKTVRTLRLRHIDCNKYQLETWISTAIGRKIQNLYLDFVYTKIVKLHRPLFNCKTVVDMKLGNCRGFSSTGDICLPSLKKLHLHYVEYEDDDALPHLLSSCPLLQELILDCPDEETDTNFLNVSSSTIKMLEVNFGVDVSFYANTPALRCLRMVDCDWNFSAIPIEMFSLVEVYIRFDHCEDFHIDNNDSSNVLEGFNRLRNIRCLKISSCRYLKSGSAHRSRVTVARLGTGRCSSVQGFVTKNPACVKSDRILMERTSKLSGKSRKISIDRLSGLPDEVICHILSFLSTKLSVSTTQHVFSRKDGAHVPVWDFKGKFDGVEFVEDETPNPDVIYRVILWHKAKTMRTLRLRHINCNEYQLETWISTAIEHVPVWDFEGDPFRSKTPNSDFFYRVTLLHKPRRLHTLRLKNLQVNEYQLETWISTAIEHKIRNFNLDFVYPSIALLHQTLFNYEAVVGMRLANCKGFSSTGDICLPSLKKLHLSKVGYEDDKALPHLLSGCPVLQELILDCLDTENDMRFFNISSSTIKVLEVNRLIIFMEHPFWILANAPALRCLRLVDCDIDRITIPMDMASLVEVAIRFKYPRVFNIYDIDSSIVVQCFNRLRNISCLRISSRKYLTRTSKRSGKSRKLSIDRLSRLPDDVICHILSFLPTKLSVSTCVLAKRWSFLWAHVPVWDFEAEFFGDETQNPDVIYRVILWHKAKTMHTLGLCRIDCNEYQLQTWISTAIRRKIRNIYLDFVYTETVKLHRPLFNCKTVVDMRLGNCKGFSSTGDICLPSLKKLHLSRVEYEDDKALPHFLSGCPLLQELILDCEDVENCLRFFNISSSTIKMLEVNIVTDCQRVPDIRFFTNAPALRCLRMVVCDLDCITFSKAVASLVEVDICFTDCYDWRWSVDYSDNLSVVEFFNLLRKIRILRISSRKDLKMALWLNSEQLISPVRPNIRTSSATVNISLPALKTLEINLRHYLPRYPCLQDFINAGDFYSNVDFLAEAWIFFEVAFYSNVCSSSNSEAVKYLNCLCKVECLNVSSFKHEEMPIFLLKSGEGLRGLEYPRH
ncbi:F-box/RNI-like/FBD-like domains-containing protein, partial [Striga asiatica]